MTTIRRSLLANLVMLVALTGGTILVASWVFGARTVEDLSKLIIEPTTRRTASELDQFFGEVRRHVQVGRRWAEHGRLDPTDHEALNERFVPILEQHPQVSSMMVANSRGVEYLLLRDALNPDVWLNRVVRADEWGTRVFNRRWNTSTGAVEEYFSELDYDPRGRIWYEEALRTTESQPVFWTEPVIFFITKDPGITASAHVNTVQEDGDTLTTVVAFDLLLLDVSRFTSQLEVSERGRASVLVERAADEPLQVVGLPRDPRFTDDAALRDALMFVPEATAVADESARLPTLTDLHVPAIADAVEQWEAQDRPLAPMSYKSDGEAWIARFDSFNVGRNTFWISVVVPESDLLAGVHHQRLVLLLVVALILLFGLARAATLTRRFSMPIEALVRENERMSQGDLDGSEPIESNVAEFVRLVEAQAGMRLGIKARMKLEKIERDLDIARDIQRGLLPTAQPEASGFEVEGWSRPADQTGGDYYDWLPLPDGRTLITLADVTGHGIGPALIVAVYRAYMRAAAISNDMALVQAMAVVNDLLEEDIPSERFVTSAVAVLDPESHSMKLISAGQAPLYYHHAATGVTECWDADDMPLGIVPGIEFAEARIINFEPGDVFIMLTDGFFEWADANGEMYGLERLERFVTEHAEDPPATFIKKLHRAVRDHAEGTKQPDDLTVVIVKRSDAGAP